MLKLQGAHDSESYMLMDNDQFEDSFSHDFGEASASGKKHGGYSQEESSLFSKAPRFNENSPPSTELVKTKSNLIKQFENEAFSMGSANPASTALQRKTSRYEEQLGLDFADDTLESE